MNITGPFQSSIKMQTNVVNLTLEHSYCIQYSFNVIFRTEYLSMQPNEFLMEQIVHEMKHKHTHTQMLQSIPSW